jgi:hypothetical protein
MSEAGDGPRPNTEGTAGPPTPTGPGGPTAAQRTGTVAARRRVLGLIGYAIVAALVFDVLIGAILGARPDVGSHLWPLWGGFALMGLAVALFAATLQRLRGPIGTLAAVVITGLFGTAAIPPA